MIHTLLDDVGQEDRVFIYLHQDSDTFFTLQPSSIHFEGPELDGFDGYPSDYDNDLERRNNHRVYWRLCDKNGNSFAASKSEPYSKSTTWIPPEAGGGDVFVPLGWLVERHQGSGFRRATLYVCCINLSTDPVSFWLIYDYRFPYGMWKSTVKRTRGEEGPDPQTSYKDSNCNHCCEDSSCPATGHEADRCMTKSSRLDQTTPGYLEQPHKWDIACIYRDAVNDWPSQRKNAQKSPDMEIFPLVGPGLHALKLEELPQQLASRFAK